ncbi:MAG: amino acid ABC transporter permease [Nitrospiria bacterium]
MSGNTSPVPEEIIAKHVPFYRDVKILSMLLQCFFALALLALASWMLNNMFQGLAAQHLKIQFSFMTEEAGFSISEGMAFSSKDSYWRAFQVGVVNTLRIAMLGVLLSTILGSLIGVGRLSQNALVAGLSTAYVEIVRNIPLLVQLFVWYHVLYLALPGIRQSLQLAGSIHLTNRGVFFPWWETTPLTVRWVYWIGMAFFTAAGTLLAMKRKEKRSGLPQPKIVASLSVFLGLVILSLFALPEFPLHLSLPRLQRFNFHGGMRLSPEFMGLLTGLTIYTAAFIAEIVRAGILAVHKGQREAAQALGLNRFQSFRLIIFPQAFRVIFPPLANQYLNLSKNSSLALVIGYADLFQVSQTISNQSGNAIPMMLLVMGSYLLISLFISAIINGFNAKTKMISK